MKTQNQHFLCKNINCCCLIQYISLLAYCLFVGFGLQLLSGCNRQSELPKPSSTTKNTPEAKLDWIILRLNRALDVGQPSKAAGILVEHTLDYQLQAPTNQNDFYSAKVIVKTKTQNTLSSTTVRTEKNPQSDISRSNSILDSIGISDSPSTIDRKSGTNNGSRDIVSTEKNILIGKIDSPVHRHSLVEEQIFELAYLEEQWQLVTEVSSDPERLWFQYALEQ